MIVDFNAHVGVLPGWEEPMATAQLISAALSAGIDRVVAAEAGATVSKVCVLSAGDQPSVPVGVRIYPTYTPAGLADEGIARALTKHAGERVHICLRLRDPRVQPQSVPTAAILAALGPVIEAHPQTRFVISGAALAEIGGALDLFRLASVWTETSHLQHPMNSLRKVVAMLGADRVLFGTNAPIFYPQAAIFRLLYAGLPQSEIRLIRSENALKLLNAVGS